MPSNLNNSSINRHDFELISNWIQSGSKVLDLGCGNGQLLQHLQNSKGVTGYGLELNPDMVTHCIRSGVNVIQSDLDNGLTYFDDNSFDYVILSLTLQAVHNPKILLEEMLRVGRSGIVSFPNFAYWRNRLQIALRGKMPVSDELPYKWYDTPNIHLCTIRDFQKLCTQLDFSIDSSVAAHSTGQSNVGLRLMPNLFGEIALCRFSKL